MGKVEFSEAELRDINNLNQVSQRLLLSSFSNLEAGGNQQEFIDSFCGAALTQLSLNKDKLIKAFAPKHLERFNEELEKSLLVVATDEKSKTTVKNFFNDFKTKIEKYQQEPAVKLKNAMTEYE